ncbi:MAG: ankyrin repeat domain-containing protein [Wolbachia pipientis]
MYNIIEKYLVDKKDVNVKNDKGNTPLHLAVEEGNLEAVKHLIEKGADINAIGQHSMCIAAKKGNLYLTAYILIEGADLNAQDECSWTPLYYAVYSGNIDVVRFLIDQGADYNITDNEGTPVYYAFQYGHVRIVKYFVEEKSIDPMAPINEYGSTLFGEAIVGGDLDTIKYLMSRKDVTYDCNDLLEIAILNGHLDVVEYLVEEKGVDVNFVGENGWTPLLDAVERDNVEVVEYLIEKGAYVNAITEDGTTGLHIAAEHCNFDMVKCLVINGANINVRDKNNNTPLHLATQDSEYQDKRYKEDVKEGLQPYQSWCAYLEKLNSPILHFCAVGELIES